MTRDYPAEFGATPRTVGADAARELNGGRAALAVPLRQLINIKSSFGISWSARSQQSPHDDASEEDRHRDDRSDPTRRTLPGRASLRRPENTSVSSSPFGETA